MESRKPAKRTAASPVGYASPPVHSRFCPGVSGNPRGRPKGSRNLDTLIDEEMHQQITIREQGVERKVSKAHAVIKALFAKAIGGDIRAATALIEWNDRRKAAEGADPDVLSSEDEEILAEHVARHAVHSVPRRRKRKGADT
jgi:hypothetical protein